MAIPKPLPNYRDDSKLATARKQLDAERKKRGTVEHAEMRQAERYDTLRLAAERAELLLEAGRGDKKQAEAARAAEKAARPARANAIADADECRAAIRRFEETIPALEAETRRLYLDEFAKGLRQTLDELVNAPLSDAPRLIEALKDYRDAGLHQFAVYTASGYFVIGTPELDVEEGHNGIRDTRRVVGQRVINDAPAGLDALLRASGYAIARLEDNGRIERFIDYAVKADVAIGR